VFEKKSSLVPGTPQSPPSNFNLLFNEWEKGKAVPLQAWSGPEGSRNLRFPDFMTTAQDGGKVVSFTHQPSLLPGIYLILISVRVCINLLVPEFSFTF
jgi:hypothetical protein